MPKSIRMGSLPRLDPGVFDWLAWRSGDPLVVFGLAVRQAELIAARARLRRQAVGWCPADYLLCRPKTGEVAVMFFVDERHFWFHLRIAEAEAIFGTGEPAP